MPQPGAPRAPHPPRQPADLSREEIVALAHDEIYADAELVNLELPDQRAHGVALQAVRLTAVDLSRSELDGLSVVDGELSGCELANLRAPRAKLARVAITDSRLTGADLAEATVRDIAFRGCRLDLASFAFATLTNVTFDSCRLTEASFLDAQLESIRFHDCDLGRADLRGARMKRCELLRSELTGIEGVEHLRGAVIDPATVVAQAEVWAAALGISVLREDS